jgi:hypothetical protein
MRGFILPSFHETAENLRKVTLYFRNGDSYCRLTQKALPLQIDPGPLGRYPFDFAAWLKAGHFEQRLDESGIPISPGPGRRGFVHEYTRLCGFALACWDQYLISGKRQHLETVLRVAQYLLDTAHREGEAVLLRHEIPGAGHRGQLSGMVQGQAVSVLSRAWHATRRGSFLEAAIGCIAPFEISVEQGGLLGCISSLGIPWYEKDPTPPVKHILNGMIYTLWGMNDLAVVSDHQPARRLFEIGVESLCQALPKFDSGFWSWYWLPERGPYHIASMTYHSMHICQLTALAQQTGRDDLKQWAVRFEKYLRNPACRVQAAEKMFRAKAERLIRPSGTA